MTEYDNGYSIELKEKLICRFCLTQNDPLTNIYSTKNIQNSQASLSVQIMACVSIEVFADDEMPNTICERCRALMNYCYQFKQMCRKADTLLKQVPLTGVWPNKLEPPKYPIRLSKGPIITAQALKRKLPQSITISSPPKKHQSIHFETVPIEDMVVEFADESNLHEEIIPTMNPPKILNNQSIKILNKRSTIKTIEPVIRCSQIVKTDEDGKIEIVSEMVETDDMETDPMNVSVETNVFPCNYCERSFPLRQLLDIHVANHVRDRKFHCKVCSKGFFSKYDLGKHVLIHTGEKPFKCVVCEKAFSRSTLLRRHEKIHSDQPKFLCGFCERTFLSKDEWEKHTQNHEKKRPFECEICGKSFAFKQGLERHEVVHSADQPYKCEHCDQGFSTQGKLARHLTAHAGNRPYPCRICNKSYLLSHHLTRHMRSHKEHQQSQHKCIECGQTFTKRDDLIYHSATHATENLVCPLCKDTFENGDDVAEHIRLHTENEQFACEFCDLIFLTEIQLHEHSDAQHMEEIELYETDDRAQAADKLNDEFTEDSQTDESIEDDGGKKPIANPRSYSKPKTMVIKQEILTPKRTTARKSNNTIDDTSEKQTVLPTLENSKSAGRPIRKTVSDAVKPIEKNSVNTRSSKVPPIKIETPDKSVKKPPSQVSLTKFLTVKPKTPVSNTPPSNNKKSDAESVTPSDSKSVNMKIGDKLVKVQQIRMTKAQIEALTKEGKIEMRDGQMIFKKKPVSPKKK